MTTATIHNTDPGPAAPASAAEHAHALAAYAFARHVRHDVANHQGAIQMLDTVRQMQAAGSNVPLPPELQPEAMNQKLQDSAVIIATLAYDMVILSQSASPIVERHLTGQCDARALLRQNIIERLPAGSPPPAAVDALPEGLMLRGDDYLLAAVLAAAYFQWCPNLHPNDRAAGLTCDDDGQVLTLTIPADDIEAVRTYAAQRAAGVDALVAQLEDQPQAVSTAALALWLAHFNLCKLEGSVDAEGDSEQATLTVRLRRA